MPIAAAHHFNSQQLSATRCQVTPGFHALNGPQHDIVRAPHWVRSASLDSRVNSCHRCAQPRAAARSVDTTGHYDTCAQCTPPGYAASTAPRAPVSICHIALCDVRTSAEVNYVKHAPCSSTRTAAQHIHARSPLVSRRAFATPRVKFNCSHLNPTRGTRDTRLSAPVRRALACTRVTASLLRAHAPVPRAYVCPLARLAPSQAKDCAPLPSAQASAPSPCVFMPYGVRTSAMMKHVHFHLACAAQRMHLP